MEKLNKAIEKVKNSDMDDKLKESVIEHLKEWYNEKKSIAWLEEKIEEAWNKILPILNEVGLI
jgi:protoheme ferro-lyase